MPTMNNTPATIAPLLVGRFTLYRGNTPHHRFTSVQYATATEPAGFHWHFKDAAECRAFADAVAKCADWMEGDQ